MNPNKEFLDKIAQLQNNYYSNNKKNTFFKEKQKQDCATKITQQLSLQELLDRSVFILPNSYKIYFDYNIFKTFAEPSVHNHILKHIMGLTTYCINTYNNYEVHMDLNSFTVSAAQRHKSFIQLYNSCCLQSDTQFSTILNSMHLYNVPSIIDSIATILNPFIEPTVKSKIFLHNKVDSPSRLAALFE